MSDFSKAQRDQMNNRDDAGKWQKKVHSDVEDTSDVLGLEPSPEPQQAPRAVYCATMADIHSQEPGGAQAALASDSALVRLAARSGWDLDPATAAQRTAAESRIEAAISR